ncbi:translation initiation factor IF-2-like [Aquila chrysaetos chrysaetos]|uniref:translation initiation factor IF-2-like n=1 Tax=Aquila chrysaetos chrysaetos TaxID=223781 RepID=UPI001B7D31CA|nr:translation initiation factor IF-2-like [Aquila chrysaetos chrysaetos]
MAATALRVLSAPPRSRPAAAGRSRPHRSLRLLQRPHALPCPALPCPALPARSTERRLTPPSRECQPPAGLRARPRRCPPGPTPCGGPRCPARARGGPAGRWDAPPDLGVTWGALGGPWPLGAGVGAAAPSPQLRVLGVVGRRNVLVTPTWRVTGEWCRATLAPFESYLCSSAVITNFFPGCLFPALHCPFFLGSTPACEATLPTK